MALNAGYFLLKAFAISAHAFTPFTLYSWQMFEPKMIHGWMNDHPKIAIDALTVSPKTYNIFQVENLLA